MLSCQRVTGKFALKKEPPGKQGHGSKGGGRSETKGSLKGLHMGKTIAKKDLLGAEGDWQGEKGRT